MLYQVSSELVVKGLFLDQFSPILYSPVRQKLHLLIFPPTALKRNTGWL